MLMLILFFSQAKDKYENQQKLLIRQDVPQINVMLTKGVKHL